MVPYYLLVQAEIPVIEEEQEVCENVFAALHELLDLFDATKQPAIEDHASIHRLGIRIAELSLIVHDGLLKCLEYKKNTFYPRVILIPTWEQVHDEFCRFAVDWSAKYSRYEKDSRKKTKIRARKEDKLLNGYIRCVDNPDYTEKTMYHDQDIAMLCDTVVNSLCKAGLTMCTAEKYVFWEEEYSWTLSTLIDNSMSILAYGIQCFVGMLVRLEKKSELLWELNHDGRSSFLRQYERYQDVHAQAIFMEVLRSFDPSAAENNLPHISKAKWKKFLDKKLAEILSSPVGRDCVVEIKNSDWRLPHEELGSAMAELGCKMDDFYAYLKLFYEYEIARDAYRTVKDWETDESERLTALEFFDRLKSSVARPGSSEAKKRAKYSRSKLKMVSSTYTYRWLSSEEHRLGRLFQVLQTNAHWVDAGESPDDFVALFSGEPKSFQIKWRGSKQHLYHLFKVIFERGLVSWGRKNGQWQILQSHFLDKNGHTFTSFNGEKESIKARAVIERLVDIIDPSVPEEQPR